MNRLTLVMAAIAICMSPHRAFAAPSPAADRAIDSQTNAIIKEMRTDPVFWNLEPSNPPVRSGAGYELFEVDLATFKRRIDSGVEVKLTDLLRPAGWEYPLVDAKGAAVSAVQVGLQGGEYVVVGQGLWIPPDLVDLSADPGRMGSFLEGAGIRGIESVQHLRVEVLHSDFLLVSAGNGQYVVPLAGETASTGLEPKRVYPVSALIERIGATMTTNAPRPPVQEYTGAPDETVPRGRPDMPWLPPAIVGVVALAALSVTALALHRRPRRNSL